jgi:hypothetical protein
MWLAETHAMSNSHPPDSTSPTPRPEFMATLGLLPPYQAADVEKAYHAKLKQIRPDLGGDREAFYAVQDAYMRAKEYVKIRGDRRGWIAKQVDAYVGVQEVIDRLKQFGAEIEVEAVDWLKKSLGDMAQLTESVIGVRLRDAANGDELVEYMVGQHERLLELRRLDLAGSTISDGSIRQLGVFRRLGELDVSRTPVTWQGLQVVQLLPELETVNATDTGLNWLARWRLARVLRRSRTAAATARTLHPTKVY